MNIALVTPVHLLADSLTASMNGLNNISVNALVDISELKERMAATQIDAVLIDVTQGVDWEKLKELTNDCPDVPFLALGIEEGLLHLKQKGPALFSGYINRSASIHDLCQSLLNPAKEPLSFSFTPKKKSLKSSVTAFFCRINPFRSKKSKEAKSM